MDKFKKLIKVTVALVVIVLSLNILGIYYLGIVSEENENSEEIEKVSESLQTLSQQISKNIFFLSLDTYQPDSTVVSKLQSILPLFIQQQQVLQKHGAMLNLDSEENSRLLKKLIALTSSLYNNQLLAAQHAITTSALPSDVDFSSYIHTLDSQGQEYIKSLTAISKLIRESEEAISRKIYWVNITILSSLIVSLLVLAFLVITPIFKNSIRDYQQLILAKEEAEASSTAKSDFMSSMSHELRTPMNGIIGFTNLVLTTELTDSQNEYLQNVVKSSLSLLDIIKDILDFSKLEVGKLDVDQRPLKLSKIVEDTVDMLSIKAHEKNLELVCQLDPRLPLQFKGDEVRIKQILGNLVGNAIKFTENGHILVNVQKEGEIYTKDGADYLDITISVKDSGIGIPGEKINKIFESFTQADSSTTRQYGGTGLGLTISRKLVTLMGGILDVQSQPGVGSTFTTHLPLMVIDKTPSAGLIVKPYSTKVLIVDDNEINGSLMEGIFEFLDIPCQICHSGQEAIKIIKEAIRTDQLFDFIITDQQMPGMDGITLVKEIKGLVKDNSSNPFILMLSSLEKNLYKVKAEKIGINKFLSKPVKLHELRAILSNVFDSSAPIEIAYVPKCVEYVKSTKIAVAEDNPMNMMLIYKVLTRMGFEVLKATTGNEVVEVAKIGSPELIFMDIHMPIMDGYEATKAIRRLPAPHNNVNIIALTADAMTEDQEKCLATGMNGYVAKPFSLDEIEKVLMKYLPDHFSKNIRPELRSS